MLVISHMYFNKSSKILYYLENGSNKFKEYISPLKIYVLDDILPKLKIIINSFYNLLSKFQTSANAAYNYDLLQLSKHISNMPINKFVNDMIHISRSEYHTLYGQKLIEIQFDRSLTPAFDMFTKLLEKNNISYYGKSLIDGLYDGDIPVSPHYSDRRIWYIDIEVKSDLGNMNIERASNPIISIQIYDSIFEKYFIWILLPKSKANIVMNSKYTVEEIENGKIFYFNSEVVMLCHFLSFVKQVNPNIFVGWYSNGFDIPYLLFRLKNNYIKLFNKFSLIKNLTPYIYAYNDKSTYGFDIPGIICLDYMDLYKKYSFENPSSWSLDYIAQINGIEGKTTAKGFMDYETDFDEFKTYIIQDVAILTELEKSRKFLTMMCNLQEIIHVPLDKMLKNSVLLELYFNQEATKRNIMIESFKPSNIESDSYKGALVLDAEDKTFENVIVLDFASLYPNIITTWNISPEMLIEDDTTTNVLNVGKLLLEEQEPYEIIKFSQDKVGFLPDVIRELLDMRLKYKKMAKEENDPDLKIIYDLKQKNYKIIINSIYGVLGFKRFSLYNYKCALAITTCARRTLRFVIEELDGTPIEYKNDIITPRIIYGDTDSVFIHITSNKISLTEQDLISISKILSDKINSQLPLLLEKYFEGDDYSVLKNTNKIELDKLFKKVRFFGVKKRYFGYDFNNQLIYHGVELARSDTPRVFQNRDLGGEGIFEDLFRLALDEQLTEEILLDYYEKIKTYPIDVLYIPKTVTTTDFSSYKVLPNHVRGIILWQKISNCKFSYSDKLRYYYVQFKSTEYDQLLREIFNISISHLNLKHCRQCLVIEKEHIDTFIKFQEKGIFEIDYYTLFEKQILAKLEQFSNLNGIINNVRNVLREDDDTVLKLFNFIG